MMMARKTARPSENPISLVKPDLWSAKPPFNPSAINKYSDKNLEICGGISKLDLTLPAKAPNIKNKIAGSKKLVMHIFYEVSNFHPYPHTL